MEIRDVRDLEAERALRLENSTDSARKMWCRFMIGGCIYQLIWVYSDKDAPTMKGLLIACWLYMALFSPYVMHSRFIKRIVHGLPLSWKPHRLTFITTIMLLLYSTVIILVIVYTPSRAQLIKARALIIV